MSARDVTIYCPVWVNFGTDICT